MEELKHQPELEETSFEKQRGISRVEVRGGFAQITIDGLRGSLWEGRRSVLRAVAGQGVSIDFLKFSPGGLSFLVPEEHSKALESELARTGLKLEVLLGREVVMVHAVNVRDEEGLVARILHTSIESGASISHVSDMHDRVLLVTSSEDAKRLSQVLTEAVGATR